tara:strand:+ start:2536 stop:3441 length:906 start_codon:yes stop_codon:yes gene_type:complete
MKVIRGNYKDIGEFLNYLKNTNKSYTLSTTTNSTAINYITKYGKYKRIYSEGVTMSRKEFRLQRALKKEIEERAKKMEKHYGENFVHYNNAKINYFEFDSSLKYMVETAGDYTEIPNVIEMDITKAYYQVCYNLKYISYKTYQELLDLPKYIRLRLLGSIATRKVIEKYEGDKIIDIRVVEDLRLRDVWNKICYETGLVMKECSDAIQDYFIFYWVDGIYFQQHPKYSLDNDPCKQIIEQIFKKNNLDFTINQLDSISLQNMDDEIQLKCWKNKKIKSNFSVPYKKVKKYIFDNQKQEVYT